MLLRFSVENWMSFRDEVTLDMVATRERQHPNHLARIPKRDLTLLPLAAIWGGNASGKSNLVKALNFVRTFLLNPPKEGAAIPVRPFKLQDEASSRPTRFQIVVLVEDTIYDYRFAVNARMVIAERLARVSKSETVLFERKGDPREIRFCSGLPERDRQNFAFEGVNANQLFVTNSVSQKLQEFKPFYDWFEETLELVFPESAFAGLISLEERFIRRMSSLDAGIVSTKSVRVTPESLVPNKQLLDSMLRDMDDGEAFSPMRGAWLSKEGGEIVGRRLVSEHFDAFGRPVSFNLSEESDGTQRLFDILPAFLYLEERRPRVFVIDELELRLHTKLTTSLLRHYLAVCGEDSRSQLIFTTHDMQLMTQNLLRRDEIWVAERDRAGASGLASFSEFKDVRNDKDIRKSYLAGRMGGVPRITDETCGCEETVEAQ